MEYIMVSSALVTALCYGNVYEVNIYSPASPVDELMGRKGYETASVRQTEEFISSSVN